MRVNYLALWVLGSLFLFSCKRSTGDIPVFQVLEKDRTGIDFVNSLAYTEELNPYTFKNFYNGGGTAIGDINNDGLPDIFFSGNMVSNRLYLNRGDLTFEDITYSAGIQSSEVWSTGVAMVDLNNDGWLDIYVCKSGPPGGPDRSNDLFINNGDLTFTEKAKAHGLDNLGLSVQASFLDYDKDGDLDCYLLNNSIKSIGSFGIVKDQRNIPDSLGANKLYRNDEGFFHDVTNESGIYSSEIGFGLGAMVGDVNNDDWPDIYISNDFFEKDYLYINQKDGTFQDELETYMREISMGSMGADFADLNNDGRSEYFVTEMLPERRDRQVTKAFFDTWEGLKNAQEKGYFNQYGRNVLQLNNGDGRFSEIGRYAGVEATDWSWAALISDFDNDGFKDIFVANGIYKDLLDLDYLNFMSNPRMVRERIQVNPEAIKSMIDMMPSEPIPNYVFHNNKDLTFTNKALTWGMGMPTFSNGSAYGDLDNDGDLDLVVNNINMPSFIYENQSRHVFPDRNYLGIKLFGMVGNKNAIGAKVYLYYEDQILYQEVNPVRGFQSSVDYKLIFGLGSHDLIDSLEVKWPSGLTTKAKDVSSNQVLEFHESDGKILKKRIASQQETILKAFQNPQLDFKHNENDYSDFHKDKLLFHMSSTEGPCACKGDVNNDGMEDIYFGGASGQHGKLFVQQNNEQFTGSDGIGKDLSSEEIDCTFFDADNDGNQDLYVTTGGSEFGSLSMGLNDLLYFGDGTGGFRKSGQRLPYKGFESTSVVLAFDYDDDGDKDLFIGGRSVPYFYGVPASSYLLENDGKGNYSRPSDQSGTIFDRLGMVTDAALADLDGDGQFELIVVGKWMPVKIYDISKGTITDISGKWGMEKTDGWYNIVVAEDFDGDGKTDLFLGNHGLNSRFHASPEMPLELLVGDFDSNGTFEQVLAMYSGGKKYPFAQLKELAEQLPGIARKYSSFNDYKNEEMDVVFPPEIQKRGQLLRTYNLASGFYYNNGRNLVFEKLPLHGQLSPVYAFKTLDYNEDGKKDFVIGGNFKEAKPEAGSYMASFGGLFERINGRDFRFIPSSRSGLSLEGSVRDILEIEIQGKKILIFTRNNDTIVSYEY